MLETTRELTCQSQKPDKVTLAGKIEKKKKRQRKRFKVKTQKGSLNHKKLSKKSEKKKKKRKGQVENPKKGDLTTKGGSWIKNPKRWFRKMEI